jgi:solute:Na+ symporter, SSS family
MSTALFVVLVLCLFLITNVAAFAKQSSRSFRVFSADPDSFGFWPIFLSMCGSICGGGMFLVVGQLGFEAGLPAYAYTVGLTLGFVGVGLATPFFRRLLDEHGCATLIELIGRLFSDRVTFLFCTFNAFMTFFLAAGQFVGMYSVCSYLSSIISPPYVPWALAFLCVVSLCIYPIIGGTRKDILTDVVQSSAVLLAILILWIALPHAQVRQALADHSFSRDLQRPGYGWSVVIGMLFILPWLYPLRLDLWQRIRAAKTVRTAQDAMLAAAVVSFFAAALFTTLGILAAGRSIPDPATATLVFVINSNFGPIIASVVLASFYSAVLTASDTLINSTALFLSRLLFRSQWLTLATPSSQDQEGFRLLRRTRFLGFLVAAAALTLSFIIPSFIDLALAGYSALLLFSPLFIGFLQPRYRSERGAFYGPLAGFLVFVPLFIFHQPKAAFLPATIVSLLVYCVMLHLDQRPAPPVSELKETA